MKIHQGRSFLEGAREAVDELVAGWALEGSAPSLILVFASTKQDPAAIAAELGRRFPGVPMAGCSTTGEMSDGHHSRGSVVATAVVSPEVRWATTRIRGMRGYQDAQGKEAVERLASALSMSSTEVDPREWVCMLFADGLSLKEEIVAASVTEHLQGVPLAGGSAGDDLAFKRTFVIEGGEALEDAAVLLLAHAPHGCDVLKHQHFLATQQPLVVTKVDTEARRVYEFSGRVARDAYAAALGLAPADLTGDATFMHPVVFACEGQLYVRSIQKIEDDGSIVFFCAVEEGMVLDVGGHEAMQPALERDVAAFRERFGKAELLISFNCILRALEADKAGAHEALGALVQGCAAASVGFDTYGESFNGLHINQTMVAVAFRSAA